MSGPIHELDLDAFAANIHTVRAAVAPAEFMLVVKDDAYRHGLDAILPRAFAEGVSWFGAFDVETGEHVARLAEDAGADVRVFIWTIGGDDTPGSDAARAARGRFDVGIGDAVQLDLVAAAGLAQQTTVRVHLKIDTGLHRNGFRPEEWDAAVRSARAWEQRGAIRVEGVWSHIAEASDRDDDDARAVFDDAVTTAASAGLTPRYRHLAASAASFARAEFRYEMVRVGAFAYGIRPAGGPDDRELGIAPVLTVRARVTGVDGAVARLAVGALDGLPSLLAGRAAVDAGVHSARILAIDALETRVEAWPGAAAGDVVTVYGGAGAGRSATDLAELIGTIGEEIVLRTGKRSGTSR
ncbi:alanine racemase [Microbacterium sp. P04]|uniref:alanine racemase n=1 Tax=Microbacterium sp. P04 TaxID=3366947 RepID=UPI00374719B0